MGKLSTLISMVRARWILRHHIAGWRIKIEAGTKFRLRGNVTIGDRVSIGTQVDIAMHGSKSILTIGNGTYIQPRTRIIARERVDIGADCAISWDVYIMDTDSHGLIDPDGRMPAITIPISIADRVWIGAGAKILKGSTIGHDSVVAAGAIVTRSFPPYSVIAGIPARRIKEIRGWTL